MKDAHKQYGTIEYAKEDDADGRFQSVWIGLNFKGSHQGFGGYVLNEFLDDWKREVCALFGVSTLAELVGKHCWALRCFSGWNEGIEGLEVDGRRFTATDFFRARLTKPVHSVLEKRRKEIESSIANHTRRINDETRTLARLESDYVDWSSPLAGTANSTAILEGSEGGEA